MDFANREMFVTFTVCIMQPGFSERVEQKVPQVQLVHVVDGAEYVVVRSYIVNLVHPGPDTNGWVPVQFRRQRGPTDRILTVAPGHPGCGPLEIRNPHPTGLEGAQPAAVVVHDAAKVLVAHPSPAVARVGPGAIRVGNPSLAHVRGPPTTPVLPISTHVP
jgi:hypothetical protein